MAFRAHYETVGPKEDIPVHEFMDRLPPEIVLELWVSSILPPLTYPDFPLMNRLLAADYQECKPAILAHSCTCLDDFISSSVIHGVVSILPAKGVRSQASFILLLIFNFAR